MAKQAPTKVKEIEVIEVPRASYVAALWDLPYSAIRAKAERGEGGMSVFMIPDNLRRLDKGLEYSTWDDKTQTGKNIKLQPDICFVRCGSNRDSDDVAFLLGQNW